MLGATLAGYIVADVNDVPGCIGREQVCTLAIDHVGGLHVHHEHLLQCSMTFLIVHPDRRIVDNCAQADGPLMQLINQPLDACRGRKIGEQYFNTFR